MQWACRQSPDGDAIVNTLYYNILQRPAKPFLWIRKSVTMVRIR